MQVWLPWRWRCYAVIDYAIFAHLKFAYCHQSLLTARNPRHHRSLGSIHFGAILHRLRNCSRNKDYISFACCNCRNILNGTLRTVVFIKEKQHKKPFRLAESVLGSIFVRVAVCGHSLHHHPQTLPAENRYTCHCQLDIRIIIIVRAQPKDQR